MPGPVSDSYGGPDIGVVKTPHAIDPDNLRFRERLKVAGEYLCSLMDDPKAREAYAAVLYVQSSLLLDHDEMRLAEKDGGGLDRETIQALLDLLNPLHGELDNQTYDEKSKHDFDGPLDAEYNVTITARMERDLTQAVCILEDRLRQKGSNAPSQR